ncbi:NUDIX hydrolase [Rhizobium giardinii]|jgi:8-oxo-dGTP pyrophosphatase MutT (NUDIX family)|uniref:NUDIX hydrolase n=1 Tax=Rhizobium giardinii TaxID=56731 RepID=UPI000DDABAE2
MNKRLRRKQEAENGKVLQQVSALPYRVLKDGSVQILLITTRETRRFTLPKGWLMKGKSPQKAAAIEAKQEAGVKGKIKPGPVGNYFYWKRDPSCFLPVRVTVYPLKAQTILSRWKERGQRLRKWLRPSEAALLVDEPQLVSLLRSFDGAYNTRRTKRSSMRDRLEGIDSEFSGEQGIVGARAENA